MQYAYGEKSAKSAYREMAAFQLLYNRPQVFQLLLRAMKLPTLSIETKQEIEFVCSPLGITVILI